MRSDWPDTERIQSQRLALEPLRVADADQMTSVLADQALYRFTGGGPPSVQELRSRYERQAAGQSPDGSQGWLNWTVRERETRFAVGTVQATLAVEAGILAAELAWVIGVQYQGRGYASEAACATADWLRQRGVSAFAAYIQPGHAASERVASQIGLVPTDSVRDGETRWACQAV